LIIQELLLPLQLKSIYNNIIMRRKFLLLISALLMTGSACIYAQQSYLTAVSNPAALVSDIESDYYVKPQTARTSSYNSATSEDIAKSFDRNYSTLYHSNYASTTFPVTLTYKFDGNSQIDYVTYVPRATGTNGNFKEVEIWYSLKNDSVGLIKYGEYNFGGGNNATTITFSPALPNPDTIYFVVKSGEGNFASCAEMEFYGINPAAFHPETIFTDGTCSELKPGITMDNIRQIPQPFYQKLASDLLNGYFDPTFRVQDYECYIDPTEQQKWSMTSYKFGYRDNPTGIYVRKGDMLIFFVGDMHGQSLSIDIQKGYEDLKTTANNPVTGTNYSIKQGMNQITATHDGLIYVRYYNTTGEGDPVKINFVTGRVNGYYDKAIHSATQWTTLLNKATYEDFDVKGEWAVLNFPVASYKSYTGTNGLALINVYDDLVYTEQVLEGLLKYNRMMKSRAYFVTKSDSTAGYMHATNYYTGYNKGSLADILALNTAKTGLKSGWGPAHEFGHILQMPGFKGSDLGEVSNNVMSQYIVMKWGESSRLTDATCSKAVNDIVLGDGTTTYRNHSDLFVRLVPFWQLKLICEDVLGKPDFYKDLYEMLRNEFTQSENYGATRAPQKFIEFACKASGYDLTDFFADWKWTTAQVNAAKTAIASLNLPQAPIPAGKKWYNITDANYNTYKMP